jgi:cell division protein ZapA (FtsZ GTPase activity inhibitor)
MSDLITVNVIVADRNYRLKISPSDEAVLRNTVQIINDKIVEFKTQLAGKDMQDYVSMVLLWFATTNVKHSEKFIHDKEIETSLNQVQQLLDKALANTSDD